jgi:hypothetical protein
MTNPIELSVQRQNTVAFIEADPLEIQLNRSTKTPNGSGGYTTTSAAPVGGLQRMRLIPQQGPLPEQITADGQRVIPQYVLMGTYQADMQRWDEFLLDGKRYQITDVQHNRQYETKGWVFYLG